MRKVFLVLNIFGSEQCYLTNHPYNTFVEIFGEICEILFNGVGAKRTMYFNLIDGRYYDMSEKMFLRGDFNKITWEQN